MLMKRIELSPRMTGPQACSGGTTLKCAYCRSQADLIICVAQNGRAVIYRGRTALYFIGTKLKSLILLLLPRRKPYLISSPKSTTLAGTVNAATICSASSSPYCGASTSSCGRHASC